MENVTEESKDSPEQEPHNEILLIPDNFQEVVAGRKRAMDLLRDQLDVAIHKVKSLKSQLQAEDMMLQDAILAAYPDKQLHKKYWHLDEREDSLVVCVHKQPPGPIGGMFVGSLSDFLRQMMGDSDTPNKENN